MAELKYAVYETVLGVGVQAIHTVGRQSENTWDVGDSFTPSLQGSTVVAAWYEAIDNIDGGLDAFRNITVNKGPAADDVSLYLKGGAGKDAQLRIRIHALFTR